jgi:hypothetical protein
VPGYWTIIKIRKNGYRHDLINIKLQDYNFRSQETTVLPRVRTTRYGLKSFRYNAAQIWNELYQQAYTKSSNDNTCKIKQNNNKKSISIAIVTAKCLALHHISTKNGFINKCPFS